MNFRFLFGNSKFFKELFKVVIVVNSQQVYSQQQDAISVKNVLEAKMGSGWSKLSKVPEYIVSIKLVLVLSKANYKDGNYSILFSFHKIVTSFEPINISLVHCCLFDLINNGTDK